MQSQQEHSFGVRAYDASQQVFPIKVVTVGDQSGEVTDPGQSPPNVPRSMDRQCKYCVLSRHGVYLDAVDIDGFQIVPEVVWRKGTSKQLSGNSPMQFDNQTAFVADKLKVVLSGQQQLLLSGVETPGELITSRDQNVSGCINIPVIHDQIQINKST